MSIQDEARRLRERLEELHATKVRIALFGQPGAGKSSLINSLCGVQLAETGVETDKTRSAAEYEHNGLAFVDLPGFGTQMFPKETFWDRFQLDGFDLFLCVFTMRFHAADVELFREARRRGKVVLYVSNKHDQLWQPGKTIAELEQGIERDARVQTGDEAARVHFTSCRDLSGIDAVQREIASHLDAAKAERWARSAAALTQEALRHKHEVCSNEVAIAAGVSAANALNPIPGLDIAVDLSTLAALFMRLRHNYGLTTERLSIAEAIPAVEPMARELAQFATKEGIALLLKRFAAQETAKEVLKWIPFVGQVIAAAIGFGVTMAAGRYYNDRCHEVAQAILEHELEQRQAA